MNKRDKLEDFIKNQIDAIEVNDADEMWQRFEQQQLPKSKSLLALWSLLGVLVVLAVFWWGQQQDWGLGQNARNTQNAKANKTEVQQGKNERHSTIESSTPDGLLDSREAAIPTENGYQNHRQFTFNHRTDEHFKRKGNARNAYKSTKKGVSKASNTNTGKASKLSLTNENSFNPSVFNDEKGIENKENVAINAVIDFANIQSLAIQPLVVLAADLQWLKPDSIERKNEVQPRFHYLAELQSLASSNGIYQQSLGVGVKSFIADNQGFEWRTGVQYNTGYSASLDTIREVVRISIVRNEKYKQLNHILDAYVAGMYFYQYENLQFSLGGKVRYGIHNQYNTAEITRVFHQDFFNYGNGFSEETIERGDWSALNKWRFDAMARVSYQWQNWQIGLTASQQLNTLINNNMARQTKHNLPVQLGLHAQFVF